MKLLKMLVICFLLLIPPVASVIQLTGNGVPTMQEVFTEGTVTNMAIVPVPESSKSYGYVNYIITLDNKYVTNVDMQTYFTTVVGSELRLVRKEEIYGLKQNFFAAMVFILICEFGGLIAYGLMRALEV